MARTLQLKWTDEAMWRSVRELRVDESDLDAIRNARMDQALVDAKYAHHTFSADFRVVESAAERRFSQLDV